MIWDTDFSIKWDVFVCPDPFFQFTKCFAGFFNSTIDFGIQRTISSESTYKVDKDINNLEALNLSKNIMFDITLVTFMLMISLNTVHAFKK